MFKMNPAAKEFVPAHILKKRQEEAEHLAELTNQMNKIDIKNENENLENGVHTECKRNNDSTTVLKEKLEKEPAKLESTDEQHGNSRTEAGDTSSSTMLKSNNCPSQETQNNNRITKNSHNEDEYYEEPHEPIDDRFLLNAGEDICEFNGEQFIIPGDDEIHDSSKMGYDFGNASDNEDEDVCNAFEEFLDNLPS